jgi:hypothetical protein
VAWGANRWASSTIKVQGLGVGAEQLVGEVGEEPGAGADGHPGRVDDAGESLGGDNPGQPCAAAFGDVEIGVRTAEYHHGIGCGAPIGKEPHAPPDAGRIDDAYAPSCLNEVFGEALGGGGLAAAGLSEDPMCLRKASSGKAVGLLGSTRE